MPHRIFCFASLLYCLNVTSQSDSIYNPNKNLDTSAVEFNLPVFNGPEAEDGLEEQEFNSLLTSSRDVYVQFATFQFSPGRFRIRGSSAKNEQVMINGVNMVNPETNLGLWGSWGGLNDVTRLVESRVGNTSNPYGFSGPLGYIYIDSKASSFKKGTRISYVNSNRQFKNRWMLTHSTGNLPNGWSLAISLSNRSGNLYTQGTYIDAYSFYISVDKRINDKHLLSFSTCIAPTEKGGSGTGQKEVYELSGSNYYNALWGYQNGKARNASVRNTTKPILILSHTYKPSNKTQFNTSLAYTFGKTSSSGLNWNQAPNPRPDYYRYLPSFYYSSGDSLKGNLVKQEWQNSINTRQLNWDKLIAMNQANLYTIPSAFPQSINTSETRARYIVENRIEHVKNLTLNSTYSRRFHHLLFSSGVNASIYENNKYKEVEDLLGATYWLDYDQFAQNLGIDPSIQQNNIEAPDKKIFKGDKFGYDYKIHIRKAELWSQLEYSIHKFELYAGFSVSENKIWKESYMANGKFPTSSKGLSEKLLFINYGIKAGATYKLTHRQFLTINGTYLTRPPDVNNHFISPDVRNDLVNSIKTEKVFSGEASYIIKTASLKIRFTGYYTQTKDQTWVKTFWSDVSNNFINYIMTGVNQQQQGVELGVEKILFVSHCLQSAIGIGNFIYTNRPVAQAWQSNNNAPLFNDRPIYLKNHYIGGTPQTVIGFGYRYNSIKHWFAGFNINYFDRIFVELNPDRRTAETTEKYRVNEQHLLKQIIEQEELPSYHTINANVGKSFRFMKKYLLNIQLSVNNLLNTKTNIITGVEQLRWDPQYPDRFPNKYVYMPGITYMIMINFNF